MSSSANIAAIGATQPIDLPELGGRTIDGPTLLRSGNHLLDSIAIDAMVVVGRAHTTVGQVTSLKEADVLKIDRGIDQPVDIVVNGIVVARGQLVVLGDNFAVRIAEVASAVKV